MVDLLRAYSSWPGPTYGCVQYSLVLGDSYGATKQGKLLL